MARARDLKEENRKTVRRIFFRCDTVSAAELEEAASLSHGAAVNVLREMEQRGEITLKEKTGSTAGRKTHRYCLNPDHKRIAALYIARKQERTRWCLRILDLKGNILQEEEMVREQTDFSDIVPFLKERFRELPDILLIASPGIWQNGRVTLNGNTSDPEALIRRHWSFPVFSENDVNTAAIGYRSDHEDAKDLAFLYQADTAVFGCGILIGGSLYRGADGASGELRYLPFLRYTEDRTAEILLKEQITGTAAILNPDTIVWCSEAVKETADIEPESLPESMVPQLVCISDMREMIFRGLYTMAVEYFINTPEAESI